MCGSRLLLWRSLSPPRLPMRRNPSPALTIYNQSFAVARTSIDLDLHSGGNEVTTSRVTSMLEPDSVVLRDPSGKRTIHVAEQNYDAAVVSQEWLLEKYEGKTIDFQVGTPQGNQVVQGKIIRAGSSGRAGNMPDGRYINGQQAQPLIEVNGKMQFQLPGLPLFPSATDGLLLKPTLRWQINAEEAAHFTAELAYITGGLDWEATYNVVAPESSDVTGSEKADVLGWVTIHNQSGTEFPQARIKLMAGDVAKIQQAGYGGANLKAMDAVMAYGIGHPVQITQVTHEKPLTTSTSTTSTVPSPCAMVRPSRYSSSTRPTSPCIAPTPTMGSMGKFSRSMAAT